MSHELQESPTCPTCGTLVPGDSTNGLCPRCLLAEGLNPTADTDAGSQNFAQTMDSSELRRPVGTIEPGGTFGEYDLISELARGGMGVVYKARHRQLNRVVALKMILSGQLASERDVERFRREAEAAANLDHPGIVPIYEIGEHNGQHFFSMKLIEGGALSDALPAMRTDTRGTVKLLEKVSLAMHYAHQRGILHRDLKPANILLDEDGSPLVTDLGLAKQIQSDSNLTHTGAVVGTPSYMPPEQAAAEKVITTAADIYSIGAILYEALTGQPPYKGDSPMQTLMQVMNEEIIPPREIDRKTDRTLALICMKCLQRDPNQRYASAAALADDLANWRAGETVSVRPPSLTSTFGNALRANLRTAIGSALIGIVSGLFLAYCFGGMVSDGSIIENPPEKIYKIVPGEVPFGRNLAWMRDTPHDESDLLSLLGALSTLIFTGFAVTALTRPKTGTEAFAHGVVSALMMSITLFTFQIGFAAVKNTHERGRPSVSLLAEAAIGAEEKREDARREVFRKYPGLESADPEIRGNALAFRIFYDGLYGVTFSLILGLLISAIICTVPCIGGTAVASKMLRERGKLRYTILSYLEFIFVVLILVLAVCFQSLLPSVGAHVSDTGLIGQWTSQIVLYSFLIFMAAIIYRRTLKRRWRLLLYVTFCVAFAWIF